MSPKSNIYKVLFYSQNILLVVVIMILAQDFIWFGLIAANFTYYILPIYIVLLLGIGPYRSQKMKYILCTTGMLYAIFTFYVLFYSPLYIIDKSGHSNSFKILCWNKNLENRTAVNSLHELGASDYDICDIIECDSVFLKEVDYKGPILSKAQNDFFGLASFSLRQMRDPDTFSINSKGHIVLRYQYQLGKLWISHYLVHVVPPLSLWDYRNQDVCYGNISKALEMDSFPKILCGDFNSSLFSNPFRNFIRENNLVKISPSRLGRPTWKKIIPLLELDHFLISPELVDFVNRVEYHDFYDSDHRPISLGLSVK